MLLSLTNDCKIFHHISDLNSSLYCKARPFIDETEKTKAPSTGFIFSDALDTLSAQQIEEESMHTFLTEGIEPSKYELVMSFSIWVYGFLGGL